MGPAGTGGAFEVALTSHAENMNATRPACSLRPLSETTFEKQVSQSTGTVLVVFVAPWSKPCRIVEPVLLEVAAECAGEVEVAMVSADDNPNLSLWFGVQHVPSLLFFRRGELCGHIVGTATKEAILRLISKGMEAGGAR
jgi:thioredoxin 1